VFGGDRTVGGLRQDARVPLSPDSIARVAGLLADRTRASMCLALLDGRAWTAAELARHAGVARSTASEHLTSLVAAGVLAERRQGRSRYLQLAGPEVAAALEDLGALAGERARPASLRSARAEARLAEARTCYDHLAGRLGVTVFDTLVGRGLLATRDGLTVTPDGRRWFAEVCGEEEPLGRRPLVRTCLDWTERRSHLGGALGAALLRAALAEGWVSRVAALPRALTVSAAGARVLTGAG
jgi:DNA-binding transcriptional ArsR family regulator